MAAILHKFGFSVYHRALRLASRVVMREVYIDSSIQWECLKYAIQSRIGLSFVGDRLTSQAGDELVDVTHALHWAQVMPIAPIVVLFKILQQPSQSELASVYADPTWKYSNCKNSSWVKM